VNAQRNERLKSVFHYLGLVVGPIVGFLAGRTYWTRQSLYWWKSGMLDGQPLTCFIETLLVGLVVACFVYGVSLALGYVVRSGVCRGDQSLGRWITATRAELLALILFVLGATLVILAFVYLTRL